MSVSISAKTNCFIHFSVIRCFWPLRKIVRIITREGYDIFTRKHIGSTIKLKAVYDILLDQPDPMFYNSYLSSGLLISVYLSDVHFMQTKRTFFEKKTRQKLS